MFITLYFKTFDLQTKQAFASRGNKSFSIKGIEENFIKSIRSGRFTPTRIIYHRDTPFNGSEFHVVDITGRSFVVIDTSGEICCCPDSVINWVNEQDFEYGLTTYATPLSFVITPSGLIKRHLNEVENYYHAFVRTQVNNYFMIPGISPVGETE